jgi:hypothetical protein
VPCWDNGSGTVCDPVGRRRDAACCADRNRPRKHVDRTRRPAFSRPKWAASEAEPAGSMATAAWAGSAAGQNPASGHRADASGHRGEGTGDNLCRAGAATHWTEISGSKSGAAAEEHAGRAAVAIFHGMRAVNVLVPHPYSVMVAIAHRLTRANRRRRNKTKMLDMDDKGKGIVFEEPFPRRCSCQIRSCSPFLPRRALNQRR